MIRVCQHCGRVLGYKEPYGPTTRVTHGICSSCEQQWGEIIRRREFHRTPTDRMRAGVPTCMRRASI